LRRNHAEDIRKSNAREPGGLDPRLPWVHEEIRAQGSQASATYRAAAVKAALQDRLRVLRSYTTLTVLFMGGGSIYILPYLSTYLYIPMKDAMHLDNMQIGLMGSAMGLTSMVFYWPGGWLADMFSPRKLIVLSLVINGLLGFVT
jgi:predicted MFS family arabinose efflux permease